MHDWLEPIMKPVGYQLLVRPYQERTKIGSILLADTTKTADQAACNAAQVVAMGDDAYKDESKFPNGAWCKVGDWVILSRLAGARFTIKEPDGEHVEYRLLNDDAIIGVTEKPDDIHRLRL